MVSGLWTSSSSYDCYVGDIHRYPYLREDGMEYTTASMACTSNSLNLRKSRSCNLMTASQQANKTDDVIPARQTRKTEEGRVAIHPIPSRKPIFIRSCLGICDAALAPPSNEEKSI